VVFCYDKPYCQWNGGIRVFSQQGDNIPALVCVDDLIIPGMCARGRGQVSFSFQQASLVQKEDPVFRKIFPYYLIYGVYERVAEFSLQEGLAKGKF
jgi:hypothetical protein